MRRSTLKNAAVTISAVMFMALMAIIALGCASGGTAGTGARDLELQGQVFNVAGNELPGVTVVHPGSGYSTVTDASGRFELTIPEESRIPSESFLLFGTQSARFPIDQAVEPDATVVRIAFVLDESTNLIEAISIDVIESAPSTPRPQMSPTNTPLEPTSSPTNAAPTATVATPTTIPPQSSPVPTITPQATAPTHPTSQPANTPAFPTATHTVQPTGTTPPLPTATSVPAYPLGDMNCDGVANPDDLDAFTLAIAQPEVYRELYPHCDIDLADINQDGRVDSFDIDPFKELVGL